MIILTPITIDLIRISPLPVVNLKQGDTGRGLLVTVTANGQVCEFTDEAVQIYVKKPDGNRIYNSCVIESGKIKAVFTDQMLAVSGRAEIELEIIFGTEKITTPIAKANVLPTNIDGTEIESTNEFTALQNAIVQAQNLISDLGAQNVEFEASEGVEIPISGESLSSIAGKLAGSTKALDERMGDTEEEIDNLSERLENTAESMGNGVFTSDEEVEDFTFETELDADTLGGNAPEYYATAEDIGSVAELTTDEKTVVKAINELKSDSKGQWGVNLVGDSSSQEVVANTFYNVNFADSAGAEGNLVTFYTDSKCIFKFNKTGVYRITVGAGGINGAILTVKLITYDGSKEYQRRSMVSGGSGDMFVQVTDITTAYYAIQIASDTAGTLYGDSRFSRVVIEKIM